uniref:DNA (cytosine-5-)-methyltransferase n=1 Tax=Mantoniella antarctica TaxID=81844 RepID=A0A7S0X2G9_9CHLO|mmetsp:Transcript_11155/g.27209  ORF Transcript_11155/g.27209 Transcript_11155/m.27209 type:complete len:284 (+) Transcript_11155:365-1216(+)|eukprot:CAMPEP_0181384350 /NCGR_PEP_ID=MMETSP1106-20121128/21905_1 /TAXON_ID=81844 /ORGANISM="Mantoniella antarctica, Strain SL-175" /LENGTH=283 /DNA_ID=CAMNT_0023504189 /DNA_START=2272 /DNA_END=3123 /DNA_ORIENTATION=+
MEDGDPCDIWGMHAVQFFDEFMNFTKFEHAIKQRDSRKVYSDYFWLEEEEKAGRLVFTDSFAMDWSRPEKCPKVWKTRDLAGVVSPEGLALSQSAAPAPTPLLALPAKSLLELFCGTKSVGTAALSCGYDDVVSVDVDATRAPTVCVDVMNFKYRQFAVGSIYFIWASPPCTEFSFAKTRGVRNVAEATRFVKRALKIIAYLKPVYFCLENPLGLLRQQPFMQRYEKFRQTVSYCRYGLKYRKNTDLWTNVSFGAKRSVKGMIGIVRLPFGPYETLFSRVKPH